MNPKDYNTPLKKVRNLGASGQGTESWWNMRMTSIILIPLSLYFVVAFFSNIVFSGGYERSLEWLRTPFTATMMILLIIFGFAHAASGVKEVFEDYVHRKSFKFILILSSRFGAGVLALCGILSVLKIFLSGAA